MPIIVTDDGFGPDFFRGTFTSIDDAEITGETTGLDLSSDADPRALEGKLATVSMIRIDFPSFADGRGFSIARSLRRMGYKGRLRATGHVLADQYAMARRSGFDEVQIGAELAERQPEDQWLARADWQNHDYRSRLAMAG